MASSRFNSNSVTIAFLVACLGIASFSAMDGAMKELALSLGAYNAMLWRTMVDLAFAGVLFAWKGSGWPQPGILKLHLWRGTVTSVMAFLFFWGLKFVPLAEAIALSFIAPLIALYLARLLLHEPIGPSAVIASLIGFSGALVIVAGKLQGEYGEEVVPGIIAILVSAVLYAYNLILQRQQALAAKPFEIAFFQNGTVVFLYLLLAPFLAVPPPSSQYPMLVIAAALGLLSLLLMSWAYARAEARILIPVEYSAFIWAGLIGWLWFGEVLTSTTIIGTALIVAGCLRAARQ